MIAHGHGRPTTFSGRGVPPVSPRAGQALRGRETHMHASRLPIITKFLARTSMSCRPGANHTRSHRTPPASDVQSCDRLRQVSRCGANHEEPQTPCYEPNCSIASPQPDVSQSSDSSPSPGRRLDTSRALHAPRRADRQGSILHRPRPRPPPRAGDPLCRHGIGTTVRSSSS